MKLTDQQRDELAHLKAEANSPKSRLMELMNQVQAVSPAQAAALGKIIAKLEAWQHK